MVPAAGPPKVWQFCSSGSPTSRLGECSDIRDFSSTLGILLTLISAQASPKPPHLPLLWCFALVQAVPEPGGASLTPGEDEEDLNADGSEDRLGSPRYDRGHSVGEVKSSLHTKIPTFTVQAKCLFLPYKKPSLSRSNGDRSDIDSGDGRVGDGSFRIPPRGMKPVGNRGDEDEDVDEAGSTVVTDYKRGKRFKKLTKMLASSQVG